MSINMKTTRKVNYWIIVALHTSIPLLQGVHRDYYSVTIPIELLSQGRQ